MNNPFDRLGNPNIGGNFQNSLLQGMELGTQMRERREAKEREAAIDNAYRGVMAGDKTAVNALGQVPGMGKAAYELQGNIQSAENDRAEAARKQMAQMADLLDDSTDEASYQRNLAVAQQLYGQLPPSVPRNFDPNWIAGQRRIVDIMLREPSKLTNMAQELVNAGYEPGTPEFIAQMRQRITASDTKLISTTDNGMASAYRPDGTTTTIIVPNPGGVAAGTPVGSVATPQSKADYDALPPGAQYRAPDGSIRTKGGAVSNGGNGFQQGL